MLMTQTEMNKFLHEINAAFESMESRVKTLEAKVATLEKPKSGNSTKSVNKA